MGKSRMGEAVHPKVKYKRIEFPNTGEEADTSAQESNDPERTQETLSTVKKLGRHFTPRFINLQSDQEPT